MSIFNRKIPRFYSWGGGCIPYTWSFGWKTGKDNDLICVRQNILTKTGSEITLSPVCKNRALAIFAFLLKVLLIRIDKNITIRKYHDDNPNTEYDNH